MAADNITLARPYAEAVFRRAQETGQTEQWSAMLRLLASIMEQDEAKALADHPMLSAETLQSVFLEVMGNQLTAEGKNLVRVLVENKRLAVLPEIHSLFEVLRKEAEGQIQVSVRTAFPLSESEKSGLSEVLGRHLGKRVELAVAEDTTLIGGVEVRAGDLVIDGSVRGKLNRLTSELQF